MFVYVCVRLISHKKSFTHWLSIYSLNEKNISQLKFRSLQREIYCFMLISEWYIYIYRWWQCQSSSIKKKKFFVFFFFQITFLFFLFFSILIKVPVSPIGSWVALQSSHSFLSLIQSISFSFVYIFIYI